MNILISSNATTNLSNSTIKEITSNSITGLKNNYLDGSIALGVEYGVTKKISVWMQPTARLALTPINQQTPVRSYPNYLGLEVGLLKRF